MNVGITGHQQLEGYDIEWIRVSLEQALEEIQVSKGFTSLAIGSDQLFADMLMKKKIPYVAVIPCYQYENTFKNEEDLSRYIHLLKRASEIHQLPFEKPSEEAFYEAGKQVVHLSDCLIAIWNGQKAKGLGGTADIVRYATENVKPVFHINPVTQTLLYL